jgi:hypothetical protein
VPITSVFTALRLVPPEVTTTREGRPSADPELADALFYLAGARSVTGVALPLDGGVDA